MQSLQLATSFESGVPTSSGHFLIPDHLEHLLAIHCPRNQNDYGIKELRPPYQLHL